MTAGQANGILVRIREFALVKAGTSARLEGKMFAGPGPGLVKALAGETGQSESAILETVVNQDSLGTFAVAWDLRARQLVSHGAVFQSAANPAVGLVAHICTLDEAQGFGLGTLVTEEVTRLAFEQGAQTVALVTDDKRHRIEQGEKAAHRLCSRLGYAILGEKALADTVDWLMATDRSSFECSQSCKDAHNGRFPAQSPAALQDLKRRLVEQTRARFCARIQDERIAVEFVSAG